MNQILISFKIKIYIHSIRDKTVIIIRLNPNVVWIMFKKLVRTSKKTPHFTIAKTMWLMLWKEIIPVYSENRTKPINKNAALLIVKVDDTYSYHYGIL
jgi:hypothetical protein